MFARKVSRFAGLVLVLAAFLGGVGAAASLGGSSTPTATGAAHVLHLEVIWD